MNPDTLRTILQTATSAFLGGGSLALVRYLLPKVRRAELRQLDTANDATALNSANAYILTLQADGQTQRDDFAALKAEFRAAQKAWDAERIANKEALDNAQREVERLGTALARVKADLVVTNAQIAELGQRMPGRPGATP